MRLSTTLSRRLAMGALLASLGLGLCGCASVVTLRMPKQFEGKKMKEDNPPDYSPDNNDLNTGAPAPKP